MIFNIILKSNSEFSLNEFFLLFNGNKKYFIKKYFQKTQDKKKFTLLKSPHVNKSYQTGGMRFVRRSWFSLAASDRRSALLAAAAGTPAIDALKDGCVQDEEIGLYCQQFSAAGSGSDNDRTGGCRWPIITTPIESRPTESRHPPWTVTYPPSTVR